MDFITAAYAYEPGRPLPLPANKSPMVPLLSAVVALAWGTAGAMGAHSAGNAILLACVSSLRFEAVQPPGC